MGGAPSGSCPSQNSTGPSATNARRHMSSACTLSCRGTALYASLHPLLLTSSWMATTARYREGLRTFQYTPSSMRTTNWLSPRTRTGAARCGLPASCRAASACNASKHAALSASLLVRPNPSERPLRSTSTPLVSEMTNPVVARLPRGAPPSKATCTKGPGANWERRGNRAGAVSAWRNSSSSYSSSTSVQMFSGSHSTPGGRKVSPGSKVVTTGT